MKKYTPPLSSPLATLCFLAALPTLLPAVPPGQDTFNLAYGESQMPEDVRDYRPDRSQTRPLFHDGQLDPAFEILTDVPIEEAGRAEVKIRNGTLVVTFDARPSGNRMRLAFQTVEPEGLDLADFRNGALEFKIKGPPHSDVSLLYESSGGMYRFGVSATQQLILDGGWQHWVIPIHTLDRMIAPGRHFVRAVEHDKITAPFKLTIYSRERQQFAIKDVVLRNTPPEATSPARRVHIDFGSHISEWDGFGINYVETSRTRDYSREKEDYSGFSMLQEHQRQEILDLVFGEHGLKPEIVKMFLDPFHEGMTAAGNDNDDPRVLDLDAFDHETTTGWMRYFIRHGMEISRKSGRELEVLAGLYGPPPWMTRQGFVRGRDLDPDRFEELAEYMTSWVKYLRDTLQLLVTALSIHNEGDAPHRWDDEGLTAGGRSHDHNSFWRPRDVVRMLNTLPEILRINGLEDIRVSPGEYSTWGHFLNDMRHHHYARDIFQDPNAIRNLGIMTSHSFWNPTDRGINLIKTQRPELKAWTTSMGWNNGWPADASFMDFIRREIYEVKVNAIIPWAISYTPDSWVGAYPTHGIGILVTDNAYRVEPGYHYYRQITRAGRRGMHVAQALSSIPWVGAIAFSGQDTPHPDAFIVYNLSDEERTVIIELEGSKHTTFDGYSCSPGSYNIPHGHFPVDDGRLTLNLPPYTSMALYGY